MKIIEVTVLMPVYNVAKFIRESIESILNQTITSFELVIIDDGSVDNSADIIRSYQDPRIHLILNKKNIGLVKTLNKGIELARGNFIARIDQDDICHPERLEKQLDFVKINPEIILVGSGCIEIDENGNKIATHQYPSKHNKLLHNLLKLKAFFPHSSAFFNKIKVRKLGGYNINLNGAEDYDLWLRITSMGVISCVTEPLIKLRKHSTSMTAKNMTLSISLQIGAGVCQFLRNTGYPDPSQSNSKNWEKYFKWIINKIEEKKTINDILTIQELRKTRYSHENGYLMGNILLLRRLFKLPNKFRLIKLKLFGASIVNELANEIISNCLFRETIAD